MNKKDVMVSVYDALYRENIRHSTLYDRQAYRDEAENKFVSVVVDVSDEAERVRDKGNN